MQEKNCEIKSWLDAAVGVGSVGCENAAVVLPALGQFGSERTVDVRMHASKIKPAACGARAPEFQPTNQPTSLSRLFAPTVRPAWYALFGARQEKWYSAARRTPLHERHTLCESVGWAAVTSRGPHPLLMDSRPERSTQFMFASVGCVEKMEKLQLGVRFVYSHYVTVQARTAKSHATFSRGAFLTQWPFLSALAMRPIDSPTRPSVCTKRERFFWGRRRLFHLVISPQVKKKRLRPDNFVSFFCTSDFVVNNYYGVRAPTPWRPLIYSNSCLYVIGQFEESYLPNLAITFA
jgi:hypothetical protein